MNPFDFVNAVTYTKKDIMVDEVADKGYSAFLTNKSLSYHQDCIMYVNEMNSKSHLDSTLQFHYFLNTLRKRKRFSKWSKPRVLEDMKVIQSYYDCSISKAEEYSKNPPLFKKLFQAGSVEEEAMQAFLAKKKAEDMRAELREIISFSRGPSAWQELLKTEADIRKKRQEAIYNQEERQKKFFEVIAIIFACLLCVAVVGGIIYLIMLDRGMV